MFEKLLANLPYNPGLTKQIAFYAQRMRHEQSIRRIGLVFIVLAFMVQFFAVLSPPSSVKADGGYSVSDMINGGINSKDDAVSACRNNVKNYGDVLWNFKISCDDVAKMVTTTVRSTDYDNRLFSLSWLPYGQTNPHSGKPTDETPLNLAKVSETIYGRRMISADTIPFSTYQVLKGTDSNGHTVFIMYGCGNLVLIGVPTPAPVCHINGNVYYANDDRCHPEAITTVPICPTNPNLPKNSPNCNNETIVTVPLCTSNHNLPATNPNCHPCQYDETIPAGSKDCHPTTVPPKCPLDSSILKSNPKCVPCPYNPNILLSNAKCQAPCPLDHTILQSNPKCKVCPYNATILIGNIKCQAPCPLDSTILMNNPKCHACPYNSTILDSNPKCQAPCAFDNSIPATDKRCTPCPYNGQIARDDSLCKPCSDALSSENTVACIVESKSASNLTQHLANANNTTAQPNDIIVYSLRASNTGKADVSGFVMQENLSDVLDYADVTSYGGGTLNVTTGVIVWPASDIKAGAVLSHTLAVRVKNPLPGNAPSPEDPNHYDHIMTNVYGNTITINLPMPVTEVPVAALASATTSGDLPKTGPGASLVLITGVVAVAGYFFARSRLLVDESLIVIQQTNSGSL